MKKTNQKIAYVKRAISLFFISTEIRFTVVFKESDK